MKWTFFRVKLLFLILFNDVGTLGHWYLQTLKHWCLFINIQKVILKVIWIYLILFGGGGCSEIMKSALVLFEFETRDWRLIHRTKSLTIWFWQLGTMNYCAGRKLVNLSTRLPLEHSVFVVEADIETKTY